MAPRCSPRRHFSVVCRMRRELRVRERYLFQTPSCSAAASSSSSGPTTSVGRWPLLEHLAAGQVERRIFRMVAGDVAQPVFAQAVDQPADAGPVHRARAHRAGLGGRIERGVPRGCPARSWCRPASPAGARHARCRHATACSRSRPRSARCRSDRPEGRRRDGCRGSMARRATSNDRRRKCASRSERAERRVSPSYDVGSIEHQCPAICRPISVRSASLARAS